MKQCTPYGAGNLLTTDVVSNNATFEDFIQQVDTEITDVDPTANYDRDDIVLLSRKLDSTIRQVNLDPYPMVKLRLFGGGDNVSEYIGPVGALPNLTYLEVAEFLYDTGYTFETVNNILDEFNPLNPSQPIEQLLDSLNKSLSSTNGCSIPTGLFGGISSIFDKVKEAIGQLQSGFALFDAILKDFQQLIDGGIFDFLNNLIQGIIQSVMDKLNGLLDSIFSFFDCIFGGLKQELDNLLKKTTSIFSELEHLGPNMANMLGTRLNKVAKLLSDETLKKFKNQAENFMNDTLGQFEEMTEDVIDMVGYRFTKFMNETQKFLEGQVDGYKKVLETVVDKYKNIEIQGMENMIDAVTSGAIRINPNELGLLKKKLTHAANVSQQTFSNIFPNN